MSLLSTLGLDPGPANAAAAGRRAAPTTIAFAPGDPRGRSVVTIDNRTGSDLELVDVKLRFPGARIVPSMPKKIAPDAKGVFQVIEATAGAARTGGSARYHLVQRKRNVDILLAWEGAKAVIRFVGDPSTLNPSSHAVQDSEAGNDYYFGFVEHQEDDPGSLRVQIGNLTGVALEQHGSLLHDAEHCEFSPSPPSAIAGQAVETFWVQSVGEAENECAADVDYRFADGVHRVSLRFSRSGVLDGSVEPNDGRFSVVSTRDKNGIDFTLRRHDGPPPKPTRVTIVNDTGVPLQREALQLDEPDSRFRTEPPTTLQGGRRAQFVVEPTDFDHPHSNGFMAWSFLPDPADPKRRGGAAMGWHADAPTSYARIVPPVDGFAATVSGGGHDIVFTVSGPALEFKPPPPQSQPTLRMGDDSADGWVEYLQELLNLQLGAGLTVNGVFDGKVRDQVIAFQQKFEDQGVMVDGIVGDQTWSYLREDAPRKPKTDGRKPHSYLEKGREARWSHEKAANRYDPRTDALQLLAISVGDDDGLEGRRVRLRVTSPAGVQKVLERRFGAGQQQSTTGEGSSYLVEVESLATLFDPEAPGKAPPGDYRVEAYFESELGNDELVVTLTVAP